jgi:hypothetical protein
MKEHFSDNAVAVLTNFLLLWRYFWVSFLLMPCNRSFRKGEGDSSYALKGVEKVLNEQYKTLYLKGCP